MTAKKELTRAPPGLRVRVYRPCPPRVSIPTGSTSDCVSPTIPVTMRAVARQAGLRPVNDALDRFRACGETPAMRLLPRYVLIELLKVFAVTVTSLTTLMVLVAQALLLYGGKRRDLRERAPPALHKLGLAGSVRARRFTRSPRCTRLLRRIEHRLQLDATPSRCAAVADHGGRRRQRDDRADQLDAAQGGARRNPANSTPMPTSGVGPGGECEF